MDEEVLQDLLRTDPQNVGAAEALARILSDEQRWDELAQLLLERLEMGDQPRATLYRRLAELMDTRLQAPDNALVVLVEALYELHDDALLGDALDDLANRLDQWPTVLEAYEKVATTVRNPLPFHQRLAGWYARFGEMEMEINHRKAIIQSDPADADSADALVAYFETTADWPALVEILKMRLEHTQHAEDRRAVALRIGQLVADQLRRPGDALLFVGQAYTTNPNPSLRDALERYAEASEDWQNLASVYEQAMNSESVSNEESCAGYARLAQLYANRIGDPKQARRNYAQAMAAAPWNPALADEYRAFLRSLGERDALARRITEDLTNIDAPEERFELLVEKGALLEESSQYDEAIKSWLLALEINEDDKAVLVRLMDAFRTSEQWAAAVKTLKKLTVIEGDLPRRAQYYYAIGVIQRDKLDDATAAVRSFDQALEFEPTFVRAFHAIDELLSADEDYERQDRYYRKMLVRCLEQGLGSDLIMVVARNLGDLNRRKLNNFDEALKAYEVALKYGANDRELFKIVAELEAKCGRVDSAETTLLSLIDSDPTDVDCFHALVALYSTYDRLDHAFCVCRVLFLLGHATPEEKELYETVQKSAKKRQVRPMNAAAWNLATECIVNGEIGAVLKLLTPALLEYVSRSERAVGVSGRLTDGVEHAQRLVALVAAILGKPTPEVRISRRVDAVSIGHLAQPILLAAPDLRHVGRAEQLFACVRSFLLLQPSYYLATLDREVVRATARLTRLLATVHQWLDPDRPQPNAMPDLLGLLSSLPAEQRERFQAPMNAIKARPGYGIAEWLDSVELSLNRLCFAISDDLDTAIRMIRREASPLGSVTANDRIMELLNFAISKPYHHLRSSLALSIEPQSKKER